MLLKMTCFECPKMKDLDMVFSSHTNFSFCCPFWKLVKWLWMLNFGLILGIAEMYCFQIPKNKRKFQILFDFPGNQDDAQNYSFPFDQNIIKTYTFHPLLDSWKKKILNSFWGHENSLWKFYLSRKDFQELVNSPTTAVYRNRLLQLAMRSMIIL